MVFRKWFGFCEVLITIEGEVAKNGSQQVHDKHGQNRDIRNVLHAFLGWTEITRRQRWKCINTFKM